MNIIKKISFSLAGLKILRGSLASLIEMPQVKNLDKFYLQYDAKLLGLVNSTSLDIGCGKTPKNPFNAEKVFGIDICEDTVMNIKYADLTVEPIPFEDAKFDFITAYDFLEHIPRIIYSPTRRFPFVELMNEIWRTLKKDGMFLSHTPIYPYAPVFRDPTHVNILTDQTFSHYFDEEKRWASGYGFYGAFQIVNQMVSGIHLISLLQKVEKI